MCLNHFYIPPTPGGYGETDEREERTGERGSLCVYVPCLCLYVYSVLKLSRPVYLFPVSSAVKSLACTVLYATDGKVDVALKCFEVLADWLCIHDDGWGGARGMGIGRDGKPGAVPSPLHSLGVDANARAGYIRYLATYHVR